MLWLVSFCRCIKFVIICFSRCCQLATYFLAASSERASIWDRPLPAAKNESKRKTKNRLQFLITVIWLWLRFWALRPFKGRGRCQHFANLCCDMSERAQFGLALAQYNYLAACFAFNQFIGIEVMGLGIHKRV